MKKSIYNISTYISVINWKIEQKIEKWGLISKMADAAACQKSHISRVLAGKVELTLEQARGLSDFFELSEAESEYFLTLVELARAGTKELRQRFERRLQKIRSEQEDLSKRINKPSLGAEEKEIVYYSAWYWSAIHILVSISDFQTIKSIAHKLNLAEEFVRYCLETMEGYGLVRSESGRWLHLSGSIHLSKKSPLIGAHHNNWRARAILAGQSPFDDGLHFTAVQSISRSDFEKIKQILLSTIDDYNKVASPSKEEELVSLCINWFKV